MDLFNIEYKNWLTELKSKIRHTQLKAAMSVNTTLIVFYWKIGKMIAEKNPSGAASLLSKLEKI